MEPEELVMEAPPAEEAKYSPEFEPAPVEPLSAPLVLSWCEWWWWWC